MPELDFLAYRTLPAFAGAQVQAVMLHPDDADARENLMKLFVANMLSQHNDLARIVQIPQVAHLLRRVLADPPPTEEVQRRATHAGYGGPVAGDILVLVWQMEQHGIRGSLNKAIEQVLVGEGDARGIYYDYTDADGKPIPCNRKDVWNAWRAYKTVAHLWAIAQIAEAEGVYETLTTSEDLLRFLAYAEAFRHFGETLVPHARTTPLLNPATTWTVPAHIPLPLVTLGPIPLSPQELSLLRMR